MVFCVAQAGLKPAPSSAFASSVQTTAPVISLPFRRKGFQTGSAINHSHPSVALTFLVVSSLLCLFTQEERWRVCALSEIKSLIQSNTHVEFGSFTFIPFFCIRHLY